MCQQLTRLTTCKSEIPATKAWPHQGCGKEHDIVVRRRLCRRVRRNCLCYFGSCLAIRTIRLPQRLEGGTSVAPMLCQPCLRKNYSMLPWYHIGGPLAAVMARARVSTVNDWKIWDGIDEDDHSAVCIETMLSMFEEKCGFRLEVPKEDAARELAVLRETRNWNSCLRSRQERNHDGHCVVSECGN